MADEFTYVQFANNTPLTLEVSYETTGDTLYYQTGITEIVPWAVPVTHFTNFVNFSHEANEFLLKSTQLPVEDSVVVAMHGADIAIAHQGELLFNVHYSFEGAEILYWLTYPDGTLDTVYNLLEEKENSPHAASRDIEINNVLYHVFYGTVNEQQDLTENIMVAIVEADSKSLHTNPPAEELNDPSILNVVTYNPGILTPLDLNDQEEAERAKVFHTAIPDNMDILIFQELFEIEEEVSEIFSHLDSIYPYRTSRLNLPIDLEGIPPALTKDGGVYILSKHPILEEADISHQIDCGLDPGGADSLANKGMKYAKIEKLGQIIHVFGTHTAGEAAGEVPCVLDFLLDKTGTNTQDIVLIGGDFNYSYNSNNYSYMRSHYKVIEPTFLTMDHPDYRGTVWGYNHFVNGIVGRSTYIDYVMPLEYGRHPISGINETQVYRYTGLYPGMWGVFDLGDHNPVYARFTFPVISEQTEDLSLCEQADTSVQLMVNTNLENANYQWFKDDVLLEGANEAIHELEAINIEESGSYTCAIAYTYESDSAVNALSLSNHGVYEHQGIFRDTLLSSPILVEILASPSPAIIEQIGDTLMSSVAEGNQWYSVENGVVEGATAAQFLPSEEGIYYVQISGENGCASEPSNKINFMNTATSNLDERKDFIHIYPTVNNGHFTIEITQSPTSVMNIKLFNLDGKIVHQQQFFNTKTHLNTALPQGMYLLKVSDGRQNLAMQKIFIK